MVRQAEEDVFARLERVANNMKDKSVFRKKPEPKPVSAPKEKPKKILRKVSKPKIQKKKAKKDNLPKMPAVNKILNKPFIVLIKKHERQKTKAKIEDAVIKSEAKKLRNSEDFGKLGLKRIITKEKTFHAEPISQISSKKVISIEENEKLAKAIQMMLKNDIRGLAVTSGSELKGSVESEDIIKHLETIPPRQAESFMSKPVREITRPAETIGRDVSFGKAIQQMDETQANRIFVVENQKPVGVISKSDVLQKVMDSNSHLGAKIETGIDKLLELIEQKGKVSTDEASKLLDVDIKMVEDWASILDDHNLIKLEYPIIGTIELIKK